MNDLFAFNSFLEPQQDNQQVSEYLWRNYQKFTRLLTIRTSSQKFDLKFWPELVKMIHNDGLIIQKLQIYHPFRKQLTTQKNNNININQMVQKFIGVLNSGKWPFLNHLVLYGCKVDYKSLINVFSMRSSILERIKILKLDANNFGPKGIKILIKYNVPNLQDLSLVQNRIGNAGVVHLTKITCPNLSTIDLQSNYIIFDSFRTICQIMGRNQNKIVQMHLHEDLFCDNDYNNIDNYIALFELIIYSKSLLKDPNSNIIPLQQIKNKIMKRQLYKIAFNCN